MKTKEIILEKDIIEEILYSFASAVTFVKTLFIVTLITIPTISIIVFSCIYGFGIPVFISGIISAILFVLFMFILLVPLEKIDDLLIYMPDSLVWMWFLISVVLSLTATGFLEWMVLSKIM